MKKLTLLFTLLIVSPAFALCSIDFNESVCSLPDGKNNILPIFQNENTETNLQKTQPQLKPFQETGNYTSMDDNNIFNNQTGCQFGVCNQGFTKTLQQDD